MKIVFYGTREYDHYYFDVLAADPEYGCEIRFLTANLDADTAPLAQGGDAVCAFVNADCSAPVLEKLAQVGIRCLLLRCAGYNNVDLAAAQKCGITVLRVPGYSPEAVAEHAMALAQAANRRICKAYIKVRNNNFALDGLLGYNLYGSSAGIVGTGRIGAAMARICHGFGMTVLAYDQYRNPALDGIVRYVELDELLRTADLISLHCPLTAETRHIINADTIKMMRDNAILVNTSRGGLIDTNALIDALRARKFAGVGLDVYEDEDGQGRKYTEHLLSATMEAGFDLHAIPAVLLGGGASVVSRHLSPKDGLCKTIFLLDDKVNAVGFERALAAVSRRKSEV